MDWNERMIRNQLHAMDRDVRIESTLRAWWEDVLYTQRWIEQPRPCWDPAYFKPRVRWMINTTTLAVTYDILARITGLTFLIVIWFRFVQRSNTEACEDCCVPWKTIFKDMLKNLNSFTCLFGGGLNWWIGVFGMDNFSQYPIFTAIPDLIGKFIALWILSKFSSGTNIFKGELEFGLVHFLLLSVIGGFLLLVAWRIIYVGLTRSFNRIGEWIGIGSTGFVDSPDKLTDPYLELGSASMRMIGMLSIAREVLLFALNSFSQPTFSFARFLFSCKRLLIRLLMYMFCAWIVPEKIELIKLDTKIHSLKWLERPRPRWIRLPPKVRWIVETERLAVIYDTAARIVASCFVLILWALFKHTQRWDSNDAVLTFILVFGGAASWYHVSLCGNLDNVVFRTQDIVELLVEFLGVFWLVREQANDQLGDVGVLYVVQCLIFSVGGGLLVYVSWREIYRNLMDGLIYNVGEWIGLRTSTFGEDLVWCTDWNAQVVDSLRRFVVQPALAREMFLFTLKSCKVDEDAGIFGSFTTNTKDLIINVLLIKLAQWLFVVVFNAMVKYGLLEPLIHREVASMVHSQRGTLVINADAPTGMFYYSGEELSRAYVYNHDSAVPHLHDEVQMFTAVDHDFQIEVLHDPNHGEEPASPSAAEGVDAVDDDRSPSAADGRMGEVNDNHHPRAADAGADDLHGFPRPQADDEGMGPVNLCPSPKAADSRMHSLNGAPSPRAVDEGLDSMESDESWEHVS